MRTKIDKVFSKLDYNRDGVVTREEFIDTCLQVRNSLKNMFLFYLPPLSGQNYIKVIE